MSEKKEEAKATILDKIPFLKKLKTIKHIEIIIFAIFIIIALLIAFSGSNSFSFLTNSESKQTTSSYSYFSTLDYVRSQEEKMANLLKDIDGVKDVKVMLSIKSSGEIIYAKNIEEKTSQSVTTKTESIVFVSSNGESKPLILMEKLPEFNGAVIVTESAKDVKVKLDIISAVQTALGITSDCINVLV